MGSRDVETFFRGKAKLKCEFDMSEESFRKTLIPHYPEILQIEFKQNLFAEFRIKLNGQGLLSDQAAAAILKAAEDFGRVHRNGCLIFLAPLIELRASPEHKQLAKLLCESFVEVYEDGYSPRSSEPIIRLDLVRIVPPIVAIFEETFDSRCHLSLSGIKELSDETGQEFQTLSVKSLDLSGLEVLTPIVARGICGDRVEHLILNGLTTLPLESAMAMANNFKGEEISLLGLIDPSPEVMDALGQTHGCTSFSSEVRVRYDNYWRDKLNR